MYVFETPSWAVFPFLLNETETAPASSQYLTAFSLDVIIGEFKRCSGTQFDPAIAEVVIGMISSGKLKPYSGENTYLGSDGKTHRIRKSEDHP